jgi:F-type H+-transporting ATPase subunit b
MMIGIHFGTILAQLVIFILLMLLVSRFALRPLLATIRQREDYIDHQISSAEKSREEAEKWVMEQKEALVQARQFAKEIVERAKMQKEHEADEIIKRAQSDAERLLQEATTEIEREREKAIASLRDEVGALTVQLATKVLAEKLDIHEQSKLVDRYLQQVGRWQ